MTEKKIKQKKWLIVAIVAIVAIGCWNFIFLLKAHGRDSMTAKETLAYYMKCWQKQDYVDMLEIWYPTIRNSDPSLDKWFREENVLDVIKIEPDKTYQNDPPSHHAYDQDSLRVIYHISSAGGAEETRYTYILIQPKKDGPWYIVDSGPGP
jgi:hypothetical protein